MVLAVIGAVGIGVEAYREGLIGDPCEKLLARCQNLAPSELRQQINCGALGFAMLGAGGRLTGPQCVRLNATFDERGLK